MDLGLFEKIGDESRGTECLWIDAIKSTEFTTYIFQKTFQLDNSYLRNCEKCGSRLSTGYCYIISMLKESGLLDENYEEVCCMCKIGVR